MTAIVNCEVCGNISITDVLDFGAQPLPDDLIPIGDPATCNEYPIVVAWCDICNTAHQRHQAPRNVLFHPDYHYRAAQTKDVLDGMEQFVTSCEQHYGKLNEKIVLDIGCNDGSLLDVFREHGAVTYGIEPTNAAKEAQLAGHIIIQKFFDMETARSYAGLMKKPDIITFTNVFAHIEDLHQLLDALVAIRKPETLIVIENHYMGSVLERDQFDTFYLEHPRTYSLTSFMFIASQLGMHIDTVEFPKRYGGNIRVFLKDGVDRTAIRRMGNQENDFTAKFLRLSRRVKLWQAKKGAMIKQAGMGHPLYAAAFPARASLLLRLLKAEGTIKEVYEKDGSKKIGYYVPGTRIPILNEMAVRPFREDDTMLNLAWHIPVEIERRWRNAGFTGHIIQAVEPGDFK